jgi:transmembrane sensor
VRVDLSNEGLRNCPLTTTFENETIEEVLRVISLTFKLQISRLSNDHYVLDGNGC